MHLFKKEDFTGHSGQQLHWKIECDALTDDDIGCLAFMINEITPNFSKVIGIPRGGLRIAKALEKYIQPKSMNTLIVDDVLSTGNSMAVEMGKYMSDPTHGNVVGVVIFARGKCPDWIRPLFRMG